MSRLGKKPISIPKGVEAKADAKEVQIKGPKGLLTQTLEPGIKVKVENDEIIVEKDEAILKNGARHGLYRSLIGNLVIGVSDGFEKKLSLLGVGFRAAVSGNKLDLQVGFSHPTQVEIPKTIQVKVEKSTTIIIQGIDKQEVGQFAASVRAIRPPEPYKGKGIRYENEYVRKKAGKAAKAK